MCNAVGLFDAKVRFTYLKCKNMVKKVVNGRDMYAKQQEQGASKRRNIIQYHKTTSERCTHQRIPPARHI
jgi:hypothetical protein